MRASHHWSHIRAAFFDVDGTLVDSIEMVANGLRDTIRHFANADISRDEAKSLVGIPLAKQVGHYCGRELNPAESAEVTAYAIQRFSTYHHLERPLDPALRAVEMCRRNGLRTAAVTSRNRMEIEATWGTFAAARWLEQVICADDVSMGKPAPDSALLAANRFDLEPRECLFIGDSIHDAQCAKSAGCPFVAVTYGAGTFEQLAAYSPDVIIHTPEQLLAWTETELLNLSCLGKRT